MTTLRRFFGPDGQGGQAIVMVAITFMAMMFVVGLAVDAGQLFAAKRKMQEAADAAAFAGAVVLYQGGTTAQATAAAVSDATRNGFTDGVANTTVTAISPPNQGLYSGDANHVQVTIIRQVQTALVPAQAAFNPVRAFGVAGAEALNNGYAIMALDSACTSGAFNTSSNENVHLYGGGLLVNSCSGTAVSGLTSSQDFKICALPPAACTPNPYAVDIVGTATGSTFPAGITVRTGIAPKADPFAGYPRPSGKSYNGSNDLPTNPAPIGGNPPTYPEGVYTTGTFDNRNLCHGIYILKGIGFGGDLGQDTTRTDPNTNTPCDGKVLIFNTTTTWPASTAGACANMGSSGNHPITLAPMVVGVYANFGIYQDAACTAGDLRVDGVGAISFGGTIYIPTGNVVLNGNPSSILSGQIIAKDVTIENGNMDITYSAGNTAQPILPRLAQ
ncbi:MAG TPA: pilus assembly protein TadG-related protein [Candidatus Saccharimonadales bacterium]|nr:pilus assembly protein TadG-related protein [Candidatus Saccharimonadales bacterium]